MKKLYLFISAGLLLATIALAAIIVNSGPTSLVTSPITAKASSAPIALFSVNLSQTADETLSSIKVNINNYGSSAATSSDLATVAIYKDTGNGIFNSASDLLVGTQTAVNIGSSTTVNATANNTISTSTTVFFVTLATSATWSDAAPIDSITVTIPADAIVTSANSPTVTAVTTSPITADTTAPVITITPYITTPVNYDITVFASTNEGTLNATSHTFTENGTFNFIATDAAGNITTTPVTITNIDKTAPTLNSALAQNTGGTSAKEAGDSIALTFSETTNKATISATNVTSTLVLNNSHSFLDGSGALGATTWSTDGKILTITLSASSTVPTVAVGDTVTLFGSVIKDLAGNNAIGTQTITGSFSTTTPGGTGTGQECSNGLINGRLYQIGSDDTVYLAAACALKEFKGNAVGHAQGNKFKNIIILNAMPEAGTKVSSSEDENEDNESEESQTEDNEPALQNVASTNIIRDLSQERKALGIYGKIFHRMPGNSPQWLTLNYLAYGGDVADRDINKERQALRTYGLIFKHMPRTSEDWITLHAIAYGE